MNIDNQIKYWATLIRESYEDDVYENRDKYNSDRLKNIKATDNQVLYANEIMQKLEPDRYKKDPFVIGVSKWYEVKRYLDKTQGKFNYGDKWEEHKKERKDEIKYGTVG